MSSYNFSPSEIKDPELRARVEFLRGNGIPLSQSRLEMEMLIEYMKNNGHAQNDVFVELGSYYMGSTYVYSMFVRPGGHIVSVDMANPRPHRFRSIALNAMRGTHSVTVITANTNDAVEAVRRETGEKIDYLHIDAGHTYESVKRDFDNYSPMVRPGGVIQLHDICLMTDLQECSGGVPGVFTLWEQIKKKYNTHEFVDQEFDDPAAPGSRVGIGIVEV